MKKKAIFLSFIIIGFSSLSLFGADDFVIANPQENIKSVISKLSSKKDIIYEVYFEDFKLKNTKDLKIKNINELIEYVKNTNGYDITAENKNKSKYENKLPISLSSLNVPKKEIVKAEPIKEEKPTEEKIKEEKTASIVNFNQLYIFINENNEKPIENLASNANTNNLDLKDTKKITDVSFLKEKIYEIAKNNNRIDLLFLNQRLRDIDSLDKAKQLIKELERI